MSSFFIPHFHSMMPKSQMHPPSVLPRTSSSSILTWFSDVAPFPASGAWPVWFWGISSSASSSVPSQRTSSPSWCQPAGDLHRSGQMFVLACHRAKGDHINRVLALLSHNNLALCWPSPAGILVLNPVNTGGHQCCLVVQLLPGFLTTFQRSYFVV